MAEILLEVKGVDKAFGGVVTAKDVNMKVEAGKIRGSLAPMGQERPPCSISSAVYTR